MSKHSGIGTAIYIYAAAVRIARADLTQHVVPPLFTEGFTCPHKFHVKAVPPNALVAALIQNIFGERRISGNNHLLILAAEVLNSFNGFFFFHSGSDEVYLETMFDGTKCTRGGVRPGDPCTHREADNNERGFVVGIEYFAVNAGVEHSAFDVLSQTTRPEKGCPR